MAQAHDDPNAALAAAIESNKASAGAQEQGWVQESTTDPNIQEKANFAVDKKNDEIHYHKFRLRKVIDAQSYTLVGVNYRLTISVEDGCEKSLYHALVFQSSDDGKKELKSFVKLY